MDVFDKASAEAYIRIWVADDASHARLARMFARTADEQRFCESSRRSNGRVRCAEGHAAAARALDAAAVLHAAAAEVDNAEVESKREAQERAQEARFAELRAKYPDLR